MRVLSQKTLERMRALQNGNLPFWADIVGPPDTTAGPNGQPLNPNSSIVRKVRCRVAASDPAEVARFIAGQQTTLDVLKVIMPLGTPVSKRFTLIITDDRRTYRAKIIGIKPRHANSTAEILYAQEQ